MPMPLNVVVSDNPHPARCDGTETEQKLGVVRLDEDHVALRKSRGNGGSHRSPVAVLIENLNPHVAVPSAELLKAPVSERHLVKCPRFVPSVAEPVLSRSIGLGAERAEYRTGAGKDTVIDDIHVVRIVCPGIGEPAGVENRKVRLHHRSLHLPRRSDIASAHCEDEILGNRVLAVRKRERYPVVALV